MQNARLAYAIVILFSIGRAAHSTPSTLVWIPSTDIQAERVWHVGVDNIFSPGSSANDFTDYGLTYGAARGLEVGIDYWTDTDKPWVFNVKYRLLEESATRPSAVVGVYNLACDTSSNPNAQNVVYALLSKTFNGTRVTAGYGWGRKAALLRGEKMVMLGVDRQLSRKWWGGIDFQGGKSALGALNAGVAYKFADNASLLLAYDWYNNSSIKDTISVQLDVDISKW